MVVEKLLLVTGGNDMTCLGLSDRLLVESDDDLTSCGNESVEKEWRLVGIDFLGSSPRDLT